MTRIEIHGHGSVELSQYLLGNLRAVHGDRVEPWLEALPGTLAAILDELDASIDSGNPPLSYHLVFFAKQSHGAEIVVKCTVPNVDQPSEVAAVRALSDAGIGPHLIWDDLDRGALAMERVRPGAMLPLHMPSLEDDAATTRTMATLARRMATEVEIDPWRESLVSVREYTQALDTVDPASSLWQHHRRNIEQAIALRDTMLCAPDQPHVFLHGDLQHHNVLSNARAGVRVIDPKGLVGPAGYEFGALTYNPPRIQEHADLAAIERQRLDIWSDVTGVPWETVRAWGYVAAVLSACWSGQGGAMGWSDAMTIAETLRDM